MYEKILVPLDGSEIAEKVLPTVLEFAKLHEAELVLMRMIKPLSQSLMASPSSIHQLYHEIIDIACDYLESVAEELRKEGLKVETFADHGHPAQWILDIAEDKGCDLIIIGTHGETGNERWRFGSVANKVIKAKTNLKMLVIPTV